MVFWSSIIATVQFLLVKPAATAFFDLHCGDSSQYTLMYTETYEMYNI